MAHFRVLNTRTYTCPAEHEFRACAMYSYDSQQILFEVTEQGKKWIDPSVRPARTYLPTCSECGGHADYEGMTVGEERIRLNVQVGESEATAVAIHPVTGEAVYCFQRPDAPMPELYRQEGFEKVQFRHLSDLRNFCKQRGVVNDMVEGYHRDDGFFEEEHAKEEKQYKENMERYMEEREKVKKALGRG